MNSPSPLIVMLKGAPFNIPLWVEQHLSPLLQRKAMVLDFLARAERAPMRLPCNRPSTQSTRKVEDRPLKMLPTTPITPLLPSLLFPSTARH